MSDEEKKEILEKHKAATKEAYNLRVSERGGPQVPEKKEKETEKED